MVDLTTESRQPSAGDDPAFDRFWGGSFEDRPMRDRFSRWAQALLRKGILIPPSPFETLFLSTAHTERHIDQCVGAADEAFRALRTLRS